MLKKFLVDPEMKALDFQDKLDYFLFNYRNSCLTADATHPADKVFAYKPKTLIDLINPNLNKRNRQVVTKEEDKSSKTVDSTKKDPLANLVRGDKVYYRNYNPNSIEKWIEGVFIKRISLNIFQIAVGANLVSAHRGQIRPASKSEPRRNIQLRLVEESSMPRGTKRTFGELEEAEISSSDTPEEIETDSAPPHPARSEAHPSILQPIRSERNLRRSTRKKKVKVNEDYVYYQ